MTLRTKVAEALRAELRRQAEAPGADAPWVADGAEFAFPPSFVKIDGAIDLEALADAALAADFPVPKYEADSAPEFFGNRLGTRMLAVVREAQEAGWPLDILEQEIVYISRAVLEKLRP